MNENENYRMLVDLTRDVAKMASVPDDIREMKNQMKNLVTGDQLNASIDPIISRLDRHDNRIVSLEKDKTIRDNSFGKKNRWRNH